MAHASPEYDLVLLGATGYTGKYTAQYIAQHHPTDLKWAIAGRNSKKLAAVSETLKKLNGDRLEPAIEICELEKADLDKLVKRTRLIITTVGPYAKYGEPVIEVCANNGTHYLDCTGEAPWLKKMIEKYHDTAKKNGAIMIPECGLDSVPTDLLSYALAQYIRKTFSSATASVTVSMHNFKGGMSGGTAASMMNIFSNFSLRELGAAMKPYALSPSKPASPTPPPSSNIFYSLLGLRHIKELGLLTTGPMAGLDTAIVHRSWGLFEQSSAARDNPDLSYGPRFRFTEYMRTRNTLVGALISGGFTAFGALLAFPPSRWIIGPLLTHFVLPAPGEGPTEDSTKDDFLHYRAIGVADSKGKERAVAEWEVHTGAYAVTGLTLAEAAMVILKGDLASTEAGKMGGGLLTPATLGDQYVERLKAAGVRFEVGTSE
ncbi:uncharacterized protein BDZ99DRAFT_426225 [Mytilinidion resinicola]|uniref:Saccharopine dehydrogenase NADP binding domain-containing protein n=1 Tax=Mytilinidion resinicola TaxID=574789 RepID=A0A6A6Y677_9PEZI|nr:uncharacterized protein BDZ99DRAFT_426225 [Mytilinidion resinicola]KAF2804023.1 hypothetical protein BDZ99DRAFT_426225 [Mytilinidion resinicola]